MQLNDLRGSTIVVASFALTTMVITYAYSLKKQMYPTVVYLTKSNSCCAVLYLQGFVLLVLFVKFTRKILFGPLRAAELEHLIERSLLAILDTLLAFAMFRDDINLKFALLFTLLLVLKAFHWLTEDRVDYMERTPVISMLFHGRIISAMVLLSFLDSFCIRNAYFNTLSKGASVYLVFGLEYALLFIVVLNILIKYILHSIDLRSENPWENKAVYLLYTELAIGFVKFMLYCAFLFVMVKIHTFPLYALRSMYMAMRPLKKSFIDVIMSRRAIRNMNQLYPDATPEELVAADNICIICREEMTSPSSKKLPCSHIFHASCLRSWFQRQQTCPTCRMNVLRNPPSRSPNIAQAPQQQQQQQQQPPQQPGAQQLPNFGGLILDQNIRAQPMFPYMPQGAPQPVPNQAAGEQGSRSSGSATNTTTTSTSSTASFSANNFPMSPLPPFLPPPFIPMMFPPPPMPPANYNGFSDEEIRLMEGRERDNVEARIQGLRNIQILLDAAVLQMQQYSTLVSTGRLSESMSTSSQNNNTSPTVTQASSSAETSTTDSAPSSVSTAGVKPSESTGAKPKVYCPAPKPFTTNMSSAPSSQSTSSSSNSNPFDYTKGSPDSSTLPSSDSSEPKSSTIEDDGEQAEVRRRRLERFTRPSDSNQNDNLDLD